MSLLIHRDEHAVSILSRQEHSALGGRGQKAADIERLRATVCERPDLPGPRQPSLRGIRHDSGKRPRRLPRGLMVLLSSPSRVG